jgi:hypothetical protein
MNLGSNFPDKILQGLAGSFFDSPWHIRYNLRRVIPSAHDDRAT